MALKLSQRLLISALVSLTGGPARAGGIYSQLVMPFASERPLTQRYDKNEHALILTLQKTAPNELPALDHYDERLIKRAVVKDLGPAGTEVKLILRDRDVRALVSQFKEPFRIAIDIFDADYAEEHDPATGMPLVDTEVPRAMEANGSEGQPSSEGASTEAEGRGAKGKLKFLAPGDEASAPSSRSTAPEGARRHLLAPPPTVFASPEELTAGLRQAPEGIGKAWRDMPPYVYRLQTAAYEEEHSRSGPPRRPTLQALSSTEAMADYAGKLFNFGHEAKALLAYEQVLHKDPTIFERDALHLWKFAEAQLGQGNLTLAEGYFGTLVQKSPESPLAGFARLRVLDIASIRMLADSTYLRASTLLPRLAEIKVRQNGELSAQIALRQAWWDPAALAKSTNPKVLPPLTPPVYTTLAASYPQVESSHTAFLAASLLLGEMLNSDTPWQRSTGTFSESFFKRFSGNGSEPYRSQLQARLHDKLNMNLQAKVEAGKLLEAIGDYEALPPSLRQVKKDAKTAWALAEAYRKLGQPEKSIELYAAATEVETEGPGRFKAEFWLSVTAGEAAEEARKNGGDESRVARLAAQSRAADKAAEKAWARLRAEERTALSVAYKEPFEHTVISPAKLRTGPMIVLANWTEALSTKKSTLNGGDATDQPRTFSPSGGAVLLLTDLSKRFAQLGMLPEKRQATNLLKYMQPKDFPDDTAAKKVWASELIKLAEDYRKANEYLDAGRLFAQVGEQAENWEGRAEALYKGGLLLYRAGRRAEAMDAFKKASEDGNNLFYANLAKERISQLQ